MKENNDDRYTPKEPEVFSQPAVRPLPKDESLFEFDGFVDEEPPMPDKPELTAEEAKYADELSEKFGIVKGIGVGFISDEEMAREQEQEEREKAERAKAFAEAVSAEKSVFDDAEDAEAVAEEKEELYAVPDEIPNVSEVSVEETEQTPDAADAETENTFENVVSETEEVTETAEASEEVEVEETTELQEPAEDTVQDNEATEQTAESYAEVAEASEPAQIMFAGTEETDFVERKREAIPKMTPGGVQITFLDASEPQDMEEPEQIALDTEAEEDVQTEIAPETEFSPVTEEQYEPIAEQAELEPKVEALEDAEADGEAEKASETVTLTPIEISAMEDERRAFEETKSEEAQVEEIKVEEFESDIWDAEDKKLWVAKKRYTDYCEALVVPPLKITKGDSHAKKAAGKKPESSGYRYEMTERAPIFEDGIGAGKNSDSYFKREMEYCEMRETERGEHYRDKLRFSWKKNIFAFAIMLTVIVMENIGIFFAGKPDNLISKTNPTVFSLIIFALLAIGGILIFDAIRDGIKLAFKGIFIPETITAVILIASLIYHLVIAFVPGEKSMLFGTAAAISVFLCALYRHLMLKREYTVFTVTSSFGEYVTDVRMKNFRNSPEGRAFDGYADPQSTLYKLNKVARIDGTYSDKPVRDECYGAVRIVCLCALCAAVVAGIVFGLVKRDAFSGAISAVMMLCFACPVSVFVALGLSRFRAAAVSAEVGGAIVDFDDESDEFDQSVIMLDDCDLFPAKNLASAGFEMRQTAGLELSLSRTIALFRKIGGPLKALYMEGGQHDSDSVTITDISEHGIAAVIDGREICAGNDVYMQSRGIKIKRYDKLLPKNGRVMYIADDGVFFAKAILTFTPDKELVRKISELRNTETVFSLKTCNPCIDRELLFYTTGLEPELIRLVKYAPADDVAPAETDREGSLVSAGGTKGFITALLEYKRQKKLVYKASRFIWAAFGVGAAVAVIASAVGTGFSSLIALGLHASLSLAAFILSGRKAINTKSKIKK